MTLLILMVFTHITSARRQVKSRLDEVAAIGDAYDEDILRRSVYERLFRPFIKNIADRLDGMTPVEVRASIEKKLLYAGNPWHLTYNSFVFLQLVLVVFTPVIFVAVFRVFSMQGINELLLVVLMAVIGFFFPVALINTKAAKRQKAIQKSLPDMLDLLLVSVESGLGFDMALKKVAEKMPGDLSQEMNHTLDEIRIGKTRAEALRGMVKRTGVVDMNSFVSAVIQADQLGSNIARTLDIMATYMRQKRRQRAEEAAMKAPVKMLFPLVFFIFPALFVVLLGPALLKIMQTFSTMF
jgi:tight adherence protein C